jgi:hypothetical protein
MLVEYEFPLWDRVATEINYQKVLVEFRGTNVSASNPAFLREVLTKRLERDAKYPEALEWQACLDILAVVHNLPVVGLGSGTSQFNSVEFDHPTLQDPYDMCARVIQPEKVSWSAGSFHVESKTKD